MARLSENSIKVHPECEVTDTQFGKFVEIGRGSRIAHSDFGDYAYCDRFADIANANIGKFCNIASNVRIGAMDQPLNCASLHNFMFKSDDYWDDVAADEDWLEYQKRRRVVIGNDTWIGHNAQIKPKVTVGHGAVVAAGAIVTKDVRPYTIVAGVTAEPIRKRQPDDIAERLITLAWWDWDHDELRAALEDFRTMRAEAFLEKYE